MLSDGHIDAGTQRKTSSVDLIYQKYNKRSNSNRGTKPQAWKKVLGKKF
jgi:hypothetical protein